MPSRSLSTGLLAMLVFCESIFIPFPPDPFFVAYGLGKGGPRLWAKTVVWCTLLSTLGGWVTYRLGAHWGPAGMAWMQTALGVSDAATGAVSARLARWGWVLILAKAFTPVPYKLVAFLAGAGKMPVSAFVVASLAARGLRFGVAAVVAGRWGQGLIRRGLASRLGQRLHTWQQQHRRTLFWVVRLGVLACAGACVVTLFAMMRSAFDLWMR